MVYTKTKQVLHTLKQNSFSDNQLMKCSPFSLSLFYSLNFINFKQVSKMTPMSITRALTRAKTIQKQLARLVEGIVVVTLMKRAVEDGTEV